MFYFLNRLAYIYNIQLPDTDAPYIFSLPDNIERSLQRNNSTALIKQLRVLSSSDLEASKYDREKWRAQVGLNLIIVDEITWSGTLVCLIMFLCCSVWRFSIHFGFYYGIDNNV